MLNRCQSQPTEAESPFNGSCLWPLHEVQAGRAVRIRRLEGAPEVTCRLREVGLCEGQVVRLIARHSSIICQVCNARMALNDALARMILVEALAE